jgi:hypothetical protein
VSSYAYADNRPTVLVDPSGLDGEQVDCPELGQAFHWAGIADEFCAGFSSLSPGWQGVVGVTLSVGPIVLGRGKGAAKAPGRLAQDIAVNSSAPRALATTRSIGRASHDAALQADIAALPAAARNIRVNQQQVNALGQRVGINRPDLQYTLNGKRYYVEYEAPGNPRGAAHHARILANDPNASFILRIVP